MNTHGKFVFCQAITDQVRKQIGSKKNVIKIEKIKVSHNGMVMIKRFSNILKYDEKIGNPKDVIPSTIGTSNQRFPESPSRFPAPINQRRFELFTAISESTPNQRSIK